LRASVRGEDLRFREPPRTRVRFTGAPSRDSRSEDTREGLPEHVVPGETYAAPRVRYRLETRLADDSADDSGDVD
jgi:hypothetical protein